MIGSNTAIDWSTDLLEQMFWIALKRNWHLADLKESSMKICWIELIVSS